MAASRDAEGELREAAQVGEVLQNQLAGIEEQLGMLRAMTEEFQQARSALDALRAARVGDEVLVPLGGGQFVRAKLAEADRVLSGIGAGLSVEGPVAEALRRVEAQLQSASEAQQKLASEGQRIVDQMHALEARVAQLAG